MMMAMMPIVGILSGKVDARKMIGFGFFLLTMALLYMGKMNLGLSYGELVFMRCFQASGLAFLFIPINTISYVGVKQTESNDVSGLMNLARNIGGSSGTAFMATMLIRRTAAHETSMVRYMSAGSAAFTRQVTALAGMFKRGNGHGVSGGPFGGASVGAIHQAQAFIYQQMHRQAAMLAYIDIIRYLTIFCACMIPLLFFIPRPPKGMHAGH
jgi:DHA2 family multidrug resistance protein